MATLFVEGFSQWLHYFSKDPTKLAAAFTPAFQLDTFTLALAADNKVVAMVGCPAGNPALRLDRSAFISALGPMRGKFAYRMLHKFLIDTQYPFEITPGMGSIEFVVADPAIRGRGITGLLIKE